MKKSITILCISLIFSITNNSQAVSNGVSGIDSPWIQLTNCVHQESYFNKLGQLVYKPAYKYDTVAEGEPCPPFSVDDEVPSNEINLSENNVTWGGVAVPQIDDLDVIYECAEGEETCDDTGMCWVMINCPLKLTSPTNHECRFGQGGGEPN